MTDTAVDTRVLDISPAALEIVLDTLSTEDDPAALALRVEITGARGTDFAYDLSFAEIADSRDTDRREHHDSLVVLIPEGTVDNLRGARLDVAEGAGGLVIRNPNRPNPLAELDLTLEGTVADKVQQLIDAAVNPALAAHGGFATLIGVDDTNNVYVTLGGGCQGCAMSRTTITEGIQRQITEAIPEVGEVIDATDHTAGENPFY